MRTIVVAIPGAADRPIEELGGRTPLEAASAPNWGRLSTDGRLGRVATAPEGMRAEESAFVLALFGLDPTAYGDVGASLDALALDMGVGSLDQALRLSLVTADADTILDPTAGRIGQDESALLLAALEADLGDPSLSFRAGPGGTHALLWRGARDVRLQAVPPYDLVERAFAPALPRGTGIGRLLAAIQRSAALLPTHEVNELRRDLGENPATLVWPWCPGVALPLPNFHERTGRQGAAVGIDNAFRGAALAQAIPVVLPEGSMGRPEGALRATADAALSALETADVVWVHVGGVAAAAYGRDFVGKVECIEAVDGFLLAPLLAAATERAIRLLVLAGPGVSAETGRVLTDPVPFAVYGRGARSHRRAPFSEVGAQSAGFRVDRAFELLDFVLHLPDR